MYHNIIIGYLINKCFSCLFCVQDERLHGIDEHGETNRSMVNSIGTLSNNIHDFYIVKFYNFYLNICSNPNVFVVFFI